MLTLIFLLLGQGTITDQPTPPTTRELTASARERLDHLALRTPVEKLPENHVDLAGSGVAWLMTQVPLEPKDELRLARDARHKLLLKHLGKLQRPDPKVKRIVDKLVSQLPEHLKPFGYRLTILDLPTLEAFTLGGGEIILTRKMVDVLLAGPRGEQALAWVLAHEIGHVARRHSSRGHQLNLLQDRLQDHFAHKNNKSILEKALETSLEPVGNLVPFLYSHQQEYEADLFAFHLCRNAGYDTDAVLDGARWMVLAQHPTALTDSRFTPAQVAELSLLQQYLKRHPDSLRRLKRLLMEKEGLVEKDENFGLFRWDPRRQKYVRCADNSQKNVGRSIVFVHGLYGNEESFLEFHKTFDHNPKLKARPAFLFRYPNNGSLSRAGLLLQGEMKRTGLKGGRAYFVCHSAGGLAFRYYAEKLKGAFDQAVLMGTPNGGSNLTSLKAIVDLSEIAVAMKGLGWMKSIAKTVRETQGLIRHDLHPDSLFLRDLGHSTLHAKKYRVVYGRYFQGKSGFAWKIAMTTALAQGRKYVKSTWVPKLGNRFLQEYAIQLLDGMKIPKEVLSGDLIVTVKSANLRGARSSTELPLHHQSLKTDSNAINLVAGWIE